MVKMVAPEYANFGMDHIINYRPKEEKIAKWHTVINGKTENLQTISTQHGIPVATLIEFNFPGSVQNGRVNPDIVNWYLFNHQRCRCRTTTRDGMNYMFQSAEKIAIPYLGQVEICEPDIIRSRNTRFKIRMHANLNASVGVAVDFSIFEIWDEKVGLSSFYTYWAIGVARGVPWAPWLSATLKGPWNELTVTQAIGANQFNGPTRFTTAGGGAVSKNYINFMGLPPGVQTLPNPLPMDTGFTIGIGAGISVGRLELSKAGEPDGLLPFKGP